MIGSAASLIGSADSFSKRARMYLSVSARCAADIVPISAKTKVLRACVSARAASCSFSMGRSFPLMGAWGFHRIGLDRPAISNHPAHAGTHCRREPTQAPTPSRAWAASSCVGGLSFHALTVQPSAAGRIPPRIDGRMYSIESRTC